MIAGRAVAGEVEPLGRVGLGLVAVLVAVTIGLGGCAVLLSDGSQASTADGGSVAGSTGSSAAGSAAVPSGWELLDEQAAATCAGLPWAVLAAIGRIESDSGRSAAPGVASGANAAGAEGPMQFEPATFVAFATVGPDGEVPPSPYDPVDAVYTAAKLLCADGGGTPGGLAGAVLDYDHSPAYVSSVLVLATALEEDPRLGAVPAGALQFAAAQIGVPYRWGGTGTGGFDCSGLVQAAYRAAGVALPRVAQNQYQAGPRLADGASVRPGDLVFFGGSVDGIDHVGIYVGAGEMVDAPHTGADVRVEGASWPDLIGATRPG